MGRSLGFASTPTDYGALLRLAFASAADLKSLTLPVKVTRRIIMQKARCHGIAPAPTACKRTVSGSISLFYSKYFSPFPHGTGSLSVSGGVFSLSGWSRRIHTGFLVSRTTQDTAIKIKTCLYGIITLCDCSFQSIPVHFNSKGRSPITPAMHYYITGLGCSAFARHYLRNHFCFLLLRVLRCFSSPRSPPI